MNQIVDITTHIEREKFAREWATSHGGNQHLEEGRRLFDLKMEMQALDDLKNEIQTSAQDDEEVELALRKSS